MSRYRPLDLSQVRTHSIQGRTHLVRADDFARPAVAGARVRDLIDSLPRILKGNDLRAVIDALVASVEQGKPVIFGLGAHVIKCGLSPIVIDLMQRGAVSAIAVNGGGAIHDLELALFGETSEDVAGGLADGRYGAVAETAEAFRQAIAAAGDDELGLGAALGRWLSEMSAARGGVSLLQSAHEAGVPVTVHVAIGTDTLHMLPGIDVGRLGELSHRDFRLLAGVVAGLRGGGAYVNVGSAVVLPEVFLKCVTLCRNLGHPIGGFTSVDLDMVRQYRPATNVVARHAALGARGYELTGHHEIMLPLLAFALVERLERATARTAGNGRSRGLIDD